MSGMPGGDTGRVGEVAFDKAVPGLGGIAVKGFLLSLITFGIYRFWYITTVRRYFWSRTTIAGSPAEYVGRGKELFLGFLVALAILVPLYIALFVVGFAVPALAPFASVITFLVLFLLGQYALYRGRRYRASRTLWRGIRLGQDGSAATYIAMAAGWWMLTIVTLGLAFPFMRASLERYRIDHTLIGDSRMASSATGTSILLPWLVFYAFGIVPTVALVAYWLGTHDLTIPTGLLIPDPDDPGERTVDPDFLKGLGPILSLYLVAVTSTLPIAILLIPFYRARETRAFVNAASLGGARLVSSLKARQFYWPYIVYFLSLIGFALVAGLLLGVLAAVVTAGLGNDPRAGGPSVMHAVMLIGGGLFYLASLLVFAVLYIRVITARLWHAVATTTRIENVDVLEAVLASSRRPGSALNEGLANALDVGGAIEIGF